MLPSACGLGQHFQDLGHSFSLCGPPRRQITYISSVPYLNLLTSSFNHVPDSAIQYIMYNTQRHRRFADLCVKLALCVGILYWKAGKAWRARVPDSTGQARSFFSLRRVFSFFSLKKLISASHFAHLSPFAFCKIVVKKWCWTSGEPTSFPGSPSSGSLVPTTTAW